MPCISQFSICNFISIELHSSMQINFRQNKFPFITVHPSSLFNFIKNILLYQIKMDTDSTEGYKYKKLIPMEQLGFLEYYMLPQKDQFQYVYRPGDDSFLMLSVLKFQLKGFSKNPTIIQIGSGSGIISAHTNYWLRQQKNIPWLHISTDINMDACIFSQKYYTKYNLEIEQVCTSLFQNINLSLLYKTAKQLHSQQIIVIFNPPYVPTDQQQSVNQQKYLSKKIQSVLKGQTKRSHQTNMIAYSYMGGPDGLMVTRKFIKQLIQFSQIKVRAYFIVMGQQGIEEYLKYIQQMRKQIKQEPNKHKNKKITTQTLQCYQKMNQELYVVMLSITT